MTSPDPTPRSLPSGKADDMMTSMSRLLDDIRDAIEASGKTRYRIARESGIAESVLSRLMSGERGLSIDALETLAEYLGLEIVMRPKRRRQKGT